MVNLYTYNLLPLSPMLWPILFPVLGRGFRWRWLNQMHPELPLRSCLGPNVILGCLGSTIVEHGRDFIWKRGRKPSQPRPCRAAAPPCASVMTGAGHWLHRHDAQEVMMLLGCHGSVDTTVQPDKLVLLIIFPTYHPSTNSGNMVGDTLGLPLISG